MNEDGGVGLTEITGRSVVVNPGQAAPAAWDGCERVVVADATAGTAVALHRRWRERVPSVYELHPGLGLDDPRVGPPDRVDGRAPWELPVDLLLAGEWAHHALWANSVDGRVPGRLSWRWAEEAVAAGARALPREPGSARVAVFAHAHPGILAGGREAGVGADVLLAREREAGVEADPIPSPEREAGAEADVILADGREAICDGGPLDAGLAARLGRPVLHRVSIEHRHLIPLGQPAIVPALAPDQGAAVGEPLAGARIIAPAGSGKTRVLTERARSLLVDWGLPAGAVALVAYNVRAAAEMRDRLADRPELRIRTLNALGLRLCGRSTTIDEPEVRRVLSELVSFPRRAETDPAAPWIEALSRLRLGLAEPATVEDDLGDVSDLDRISRAYRAELARRNVADFDEQIVAAIDRLLADPAFRARSQRHARVLLVDEFQDLTPAHMLMLRLLAGPAGAVFGVGDDDQTIYGYAGATPRWLVDFDQWFPGSASHPLEVNYRCPAPVVTAAANLLSRNALRVAKAIRPSAGAASQGLEVVHSGSSGAVAATAGKAAALVGAGVDPADIAVLSRVNAALVPVQVLLGHEGVSVNGTGDGRFLARGGVRAALAWLDLASSPAGSQPGPALREAARRPKRGMNNSLLDLIARSGSIESLEGLSVWLEGKGSIREADKVEDFVADVALVRSVAGQGTAAVLQAVRSKIGSGGLDASASALDQWSHGAIAAHADDLDALSDLAPLEPDPTRFRSWLVERLKRPPDPRGVTLASIHSVKGREWPHVILHQVTDGIIPHRLATDDEEERRIFHVGLTRGSLSVTVIAGHPASPLIAEMDEPGRPPRGSSTRSGVRPGPVSAGGPGAGRGAAGGGGSRTGPAASGGNRRARAAVGSPGSDVTPGGVEQITPARAGLVFAIGGHEHTVVETTADGARCRIGDGPALTSIPYGRSVSTKAGPALLAHPSATLAWERLRQWRAERSKAAKVPAYVIFDDRTLRLIAVSLPVTEAALLRLRGIGPAKFESYGSDVLSITEEIRSLAASSPPPEGGP